MKWLESIVIDLASDFKEGYYGTFQRNVRPWDDVGEAERILAQCILSSGWNYRKSVFAGALFVQEVTKKFRSERNIPLETVSEFLTRSDIRHRFPNKRALHLKCSMEKLWEVCELRSQSRDRFHCDLKFRDYLVTNFSGLGLKQASMFLRDTGYTQNLAIIDTHVIWYFENVVGKKLNARSRSAYLQSEHDVMSHCNEIGVPVGIVDMLIWNVVKSYKSYLEQHKWQKQYVLPLEASTPQHAFIS